MKSEPADEALPKVTIKVRDIMSAPAITVEADQPLLIACSLLDHYRIDHLPVVRQMRVVGLLSRSDLATRVSAAEQDKPQRAIIFSRTPVVTIGPDESIARASDMMRAQRLKCLPVVVGEALLGVVTRSDIAKGFPRAKGTTRPFPTCW